MVTISKKESQQLRDQITENYFEAVAKAAFIMHPTLNSCMVMVAQYWNDEADDETHISFVFSELETPNTEAYFKAYNEDVKDTVNLSITPVHEYYSLDYQINDVINALTGERPKYKYSQELILAFACFCNGGDQCNYPEENYYPYCIIRRHGYYHVKTEVVGKMLRPELDGVRY